MTVPPPVLELAGVTKSFVGTHALDNVSLAVAAGEVRGLVGENGAGKSTLIRVATGAMSPDEGVVRIDGQAVTSLSRRAMQARGVRAIFQERQIAGFLSVAENVLLDRLPRNRLGLVAWGSANRTAAERLARVGLDIDPTTPARRLSVAQLQLVEIARAVSWDARLIVMDEPTASLHHDEVRALFSVIASLRASGVAVLYISHHLDEVFEICDAITVLRDGKHVGDRRIADTTTGEVVSMIFGRDVETPEPSDRSRAAGRPILVAEEISSGVAVRGVSLTVAPGEVLAVTGGLGAGTSALAEALSGCAPLRAGRVTVDGVAVTTRTRAARSIAFVPSDRKRRALLLDRSVAENVGLGKLATGGPLVVRPGAVRARAEAMCAATRVRAGSVQAVVRTLSGGNQQKVVLGRWLDLGSRVLIVDEPTAGIDIAAKFEIYRLLRKLADEGAAVVVCTTDFQEVAQVADRVLVMRDGRVVGGCEAAEATEHRLIELEMAG